MPAAPPSSAPTPVKRRVVCSRAVQSDHRSPFGFLTPRCLVEEPGRSDRIRHSGPLYTSDHHPPRLQEVDALIVLYISVTVGDAAGIANGILQRDLHCQTNRWHRHPDLHLLDGGRRSRTDLSGGRRNDPHISITGTSGSRAQQSSLAMKNGAHSRSA